MLCAFAKLACVFGLALFFAFAFRGLRRVYGLNNFFKHDFHVLRLYMVYYHALYAVSYFAVVSFASKIQPSSSGNYRARLVWNAHAWYMCVGVQVGFHGQRSSVGAHCHVLQAGCHGRCFSRAWISMVAETCVCVCFA